MDNARWDGVPFYVRTGKRLTRQWTEIVLHFKRTVQPLFTGAPEESIGSNWIALRIQPDEGISIAFAAKEPGDEMVATGVEADFSYATSVGGQMPSAYATLLLDVMLGDPTRFTRRDEVEAEWRVITPIEEAWAQWPAPPFPNYVAGSAGPAAADDLMSRNGRHWRSIAPEAGGDGAGSPTVGE